MPDSVTMFGALSFMVTVSLLATVTVLPPPVRVAFSPSLRVIVELLVLIVFPRPTNPPPPLARKIESMSEASKLFEPLDRPATQHERDIVRWLLEHGDPQYLPFASQIDTLRVVSKCICGCPTVDFALEGDPPLRKGSHLISDFGATVDDQQVGVLLFACNGSLSMLEVYSCAGDVDLIAVVRVTEHEQLADVIAGRLSKVDGVHRTDTHIAFRSYSRADTEATFSVGLS